MTTGRLERTGSPTSGVDGPVRVGVLLGRRYVSQSLRPSTSSPTRSEPNPDPTPSRGCRSRRRRYPSSPPTRRTGHPTPNSLGVPLRVVTREIKSDPPPSYTVSSPDWEPDVPGSILRVPGPYKCRVSVPLIPRPLQDPSLGLWDVPTGTGSRLSYGTVVDVGSGVGREQGLGLFFDQVPRC